MCKTLLFENRRPNLLNTGFAIDPDLIALSNDEEPHATHHKFTMMSESGDLHPIAESHCERDLGVLVDNRLNWAKHRENIKAKAYSGHLKP